MKKGLLGGTAIVGAAALMAGVAGAAEAPTWKLTGNANFQFYYVDQDWVGYSEDGSWATTELSNASGLIQDHGWYFGVDEAELQLNVSGAADNGLNYGFKIEINANTTDNTVVDEVRLQFSGGWGTVQMGDEDGAEDIMNYGGENLMGATGGFDGDFDDVLIRQATTTYSFGGSIGDRTFSNHWGGASYPTIAGDTSDKTKVSYFSPRFSGFQVGASLTPTPNNGDNFKEDGGWENHIGLGANYDNSFGDLRVRASAVYSAASSTSTAYEDIAAFSVGGIVGWGPFAVGANYTDNGESGEPVGLGWESSYWDVAASFETGPMYFSVGYLSSIRSWGVLESPGSWTDSEFSTVSLTADYTVAPGLAVYAEIDLIEDSLWADDTGARTGWDNNATIFIAGANISF